MPTIKSIRPPWIKTWADQKHRWSIRPQGDIPENFYRLAAWKKLRKARLRENPLCQHCLAKDKVVTATVVDHITPIRLGGEPLEYENTQSLCKRCHASKSARERHLRTPPKPDV